MASGVVGMMRTIDGAARIGGRMLIIAPGLGRDRECLVGRPFFFSGVMAICSFFYLSLWRE